MVETTKAVVSTFFQIGGAVGFGLFLFGVLPTLLFIKFFGNKR